MSRPLTPVAGPYSSLAVLRDRFMRLGFELDRTLETSLGEVYDASLKGNPRWLTVSDLRVKLVGPKGELVVDDEGRRLDFDLSPPSHAAIELAAQDLAPWAQEHHLVDGWCIEWIIKNKFLDRWASERSAAGVTRDVCLVPTPLKPAVFAPTISWQRGEESRSEFVARALTQIRKELNSFCDDAEKSARAAGYVRVRERGQIEEHLNWLVRFQIKGERPAKIWNRQRSWKGTRRTAGRRAVEKAIRETAELIGLTPHPHKKCELRARRA